MKLKENMFCLGTQEHMDALIRDGVKPGCLGYDLKSGDNYLLIVSGEPLGLYNRGIHELYQGVDTQIELVDGEWKIQGDALEREAEDWKKRRERADAIWDEVFNEPPVQS